MDNIDINNLSSIDPDNDMNNMNGNNNGGLGFGIISLVLGIFSVMCSCCLFPIAAICSIIGISLGVLSVRIGGKGKVFGIAGIVLSIIALVIVIILVVLSIISGVSKLL